MAQAQLNYKNSKSQSPSSKRLKLEQVLSVLPVRQEEYQLNDVKKRYRVEMDVKVDPHFSIKRHIVPSALQEIHSETMKSILAKVALEGQQPSTSGQVQTPAAVSVSKEDMTNAMVSTFKDYKDTNFLFVPDNLAIGIDLGTTYSCVAVYERGQVKVIPNYNTGKMTTPSYVLFGSIEDNKVSTVVGDSAKSDAHESPLDTIFDAKRIIGRSFNDPVLQKDMELWPFNVVDDQGVPKIVAKGRSYHPEQISARILEEMKKVAETYLGSDVTKAVITVPAYFTDGQRQATVDAGELAGLQVLQIINEPTAAAIAYRLERKDLTPRHVLVFDFGGGTLDVSVLMMEDGKIDVKAVDGDTHLGGEDIDHNLVQYCIKEYNRVQTKPTLKLNIGNNCNDKMSRQKYARRLRRLRNACEEKKIALSAGKEVKVVVDSIYRSSDLKVVITRQQFEEMNMPLFQTAINIVQRVLTKANIKKDDIEDIVLVGGSTRIPKMQEMLRAFFGPTKKLSTCINQDQAVAYGAAIQAAIINGHIAAGSPDYISLHDVTPHSLGIQAVEQNGITFAVIIPKNTPVPVAIEKDTFRTVNDNQTLVMVRVYQGESDKVKENTLLGQFGLTVPPKKAGEEKIKVTMDVDAQGILQIKATCLSTGGMNEITIEANKKRLSKEDIQKLKDEGL